MIEKGCHRLGRQLLLVYLSIKLHLLSLLIQPFFQRIQRALLMFWANHTHANLLPALLRCRRKRAPCRVIEKRWHDDGRRLLLVYLLSLDFREVERTLMFWPKHNTAMHHGTTPGHLTSFHGFDELLELERLDAFRNIGVLMVDRELEDLLVGSGRRWSRGSLRRARG